MKILNCLPKFLPHLCLKQLVYLHFDDVPEHSSRTITHAPLQDWHNFVRKNPNIKEMVFESSRFIFPLIEILVKGLKHLEKLKIIMKWYQWHDRANLPDVKCLRKILEHSKKLTMLKIDGMRGRKTDYKNFFRKYSKRLQNVTLDLEFADDEYPQKPN